MSDPLSDFDPAPVVPLEYERSGISPWRLIAWWVCLISAILLGAELLIEAAQAALSCVMANGRGNMIVGPYPGILIYNLLPLAAHSVMLAGCLQSMRQQAIGRRLVIWGSIAGLTINVILLAVSHASYLTQFGPISSAARSLGSISTYYLYSSLLMIWGNFVRSSFIPVLLLCIFYRREVRQTFHGSI